MYTDVLFDIININDGHSNDVLVNMADIKIAFGDSWFVLLYKDTAAYGHHEIKKNAKNKIRD